MLKATTFLLLAIAEISGGIYPQRCMVWVHNLIISGDNQEEMIDNLDGLR